jgi:hypothetical protein
MRINRKGHLKNNFKRVPSSSPARDWIEIKSLGKLLFFQEGYSISSFI